MAPVIRISDETYARMQRHAKPFEDTPENIIIKALTALDMMDGETPSPAHTPAAKRSETPKLPQKEFRVPLLMTLMKFGGKAQAKDIRSLLGPVIAPKLTDGDFENVSTGDPRWWNAACWERSELVKDGLMRADSDRGIWEISDDGMNMAATLHRTENGTDRVIESGTLREIAEKFWRRQIGSRPFVMVGDVIFDPIMLRRIDELSLSVRSANCLRNDGIIYIGELVQRTEAELTRTPNFGRKSINEINEELGRFGLKIGMTVPGSPMKIVDEGAGTMVWGKRRFKDVEYVPYFERFEKLLIANGAEYRKFIMVSTKTRDPFVDDFYIGVPNEAFLMLFDGFERVGELDLPAEINTLHIADATTQEFKSRFTFAKDLN